VACLRHSGIVESQKSVNTAITQQYGRRSFLRAVPSRTEPHRALLHIVAVNKLSAVLPSNASVNTFAQQHRGCDFWAVRAEESSWRPSELTRQTLRVVGGDEKGKSQISDSKIWSRVPTDSDPRKTALGRPSSIYKRQTRPLVREGAPQKQDHNCQTAINIWSLAPDEARHQDLLTD
jgi:hypothetical protein